MVPPPFPFTKHNRAAASWTYVAHQLFQHPLGGFYRNGLSNRVVVHPKAPRTLGLDPAPGTCHPHRSAKKHSARRLVRWIPSRSRSAREALRDGRRFRIPTFVDDFTLSSLRAVCEPPLVVVRRGASRVMGRNLTGILVLPGMPLKSSSHLCPGVP